MPSYISKFRGYSSIGTSFLNPVLYDLALAKQDLLNHFNTRKGERIMMPEFGSIVWDMLFEPLDDFTIGLIDADVRLIIKSRRTPRPRIGRPPMHSPGRPPCRMA